MARADLMALTEAALAQMANAGLVKRGLRDLAAGQAPEMTETPDGVIEARFSDGAVTRLSAGCTPAEASCSCPSSTMCRHRVTLVLAYQQRNAEEASTAEAQPAPRDWDPASLDLEGFEASLSAAARADLQRLLASSLAVRLERGQTPAAHLPMAAVRFLAPNNIAYARCDCAQSTGCAHIALALRAFRAAAGQMEAIIGAKALPSTGSSGLEEVTDAVLSLLLQEGVIAGIAAHGRGLDRARRVAGEKGATWLVLAIEALAAQIEAYGARSAHYDEDTVFSLAAELYARTRCRDGGAALGLGEAMETPMAKTRLVSLGARAVTKGPEVTASALLADTDTGAAMLMEKRFPLEAANGQRETPDRTGGRFFAPGLQIRGVARGQILTSVARRRADGVVTFGAGGAGKTSLMPGTGMPKLPPPLLVAGLESLRAAFERRPPSFIGPRNRVQDMHVFDVEAVTGQRWAPGAQTWQAAVTLPDGGGTLYLERRYDAAAPWALETLFATAAGKRGAVRRITGTVRVEVGGVVCEPWSLTADELIVPDFDGEPEDGAEPPIADSRGEAVSPPGMARRFLAGAVHAGRHTRDAQFASRGQQVATRLRQEGFEATARRMEEWLAAKEDGVAAFCRAAIWLATLLEA
jgi:hypothetical protein